MLQPAWAWAILGLILLGAEMLSGTFYILWFGVAALSVSLLLFLLPEASFAMQLLAFSTLSVTTLAIWKIRYAGTPPTLRVGQSQGDAIGCTGSVSAPVSPQQLGRIQFTLPVMGSREWTAISDQTLDTGTSAEVIGIEGNYLRVRRAPPQQGE